MRVSTTIVAMPLRSKLQVILVCGWLFGAACDRPQPAAPESASPDRFKPSAAQAESALKAVFDAWREGHPTGMVPGASSPEVHVTDTFRKPDEKLVDYHILGEVPFDGPRCYAVDLRFEPERVERVRFTISGIDPLWVFRLEDAQHLAHWEHNMDAPAAGEDAAAAGETSEAEGEREATSAGTDQNSETTADESAP